jgi:hypothetical protein
MRHNAAYDKRMRALGLAEKAAGNAVRDAATSFHIPMKPWSRQSSTAPGAACASAELSVKSCSLQHQAAEGDPPDHPEKAGGRETEKLRPRAIAAMVAGNVPVILQSFHLTSFSGPLATASQPGEQSPGAFAR